MSLANINNFYKCCQLKKFLKMVVDSLLRLTFLEGVEVDPQAFKSQIFETTDTFFPSSISNWWWCSGQKWTDLFILPEIKCLMGVFIYFSQEVSKPWMSGWTHVLLPLYYYYILKLSDIILTLPNGNSSIYWALTPTSFCYFRKPSLAWRKEYVLCRGHHNFNKIEPFFPLLAT